MAEENYELRATIQMEKAVDYFKVLSQHQQRLKLFGRHMHLLKFRFKIS